MNGDPRLYKLLDELHIPYEYLEHPPAPTIEIAKQYWAGHDAKHCKNLFFLKQKSYYPGCDGLPWHFTGSVAAHFEEVLREAAKSAGCETGEIAGDPMERLIAKQNRQ